MPVIAESAVWTPEVPSIMVQKLSLALETLGLKKVPENSCIMLNDWMILFFFVDDLVIMTKAKDLLNQPFTLYLNLKVCNNFNRKGNTRSEKGRSTCNFTW